MKPAASVARRALVCVIDDDQDVRDALDSLLRASGYTVRTFAGPEEFLCCDNTDLASCLILDVRLGKTNGLDFQQSLAESDVHVPVILMSGYGSIPMTVRGMRAGAVTFLSKPFDDTEMLSAIAEAIEKDGKRRLEEDAQATLRGRYDSLTPRERDVMGLVTAGLMNKQIAAHLKLSEITVKIHRGNLMRKMQG